MFRYIPKETVLFAFPEEEAIVSYLAKHPFTKDLYVYDRKLIEAIAKKAANGCLHESGIDNCVALCFYDCREMLGARLKEAIDLQMLSYTMRKNCVAVLKDCASGKPLDN